MDKATNFNENFIPKINEILDFALKNPYSNFYRNKYKNQIPYPIRSYQDFEKIPLLTKNDILGVPLENRIFVPEKEIAYYSFSSGTAKFGQPTIIPHSDLNFSPFLKHAYPEDKLISLGIKKIMILRPPMSPPFFKFMALPKKGTVVVPGDIKNLNLSAKISKELKIEGFIITPTILDFLIPVLEQIKFNLLSIKFILLGGEYCSKQKLDHLKNIFPSAYFNLIYGNSETGGPQGYQCEHLKNAPQRYHPVDSLLFEITDAPSVSEFEKYEKITITDLKHRAFPLIRYQTDDMGKLIQKNCLCGENFTIDLGGRAELDIFKFHGVTINTQAVENSLMPMEHILFPDRFQIQVLEVNIAGKLKPKLKIDVQLKKEFEKNRDIAHFKKTLEENISKKLSLSGKSTLQSLVEKNIFLPLEIQFVNSWPEGKFKHIVSYLS